jgi:DNA-directed RNA polymerase beta subunit
VTSDNKTTTITVKLRIMRIPQAGDKFAPRNAQKGTIGLVMSDIDMPYTERGIVPDIIVNPHSMPTRMTGSYPMELIASKFAALQAMHINGSAFQPFKLEEYRKVLKENGFDEMGWEKMRSGSSGKPLEALIYSGPVFFQALKHHVKDKIQVRSTGQVKPMTRQPPKGRGNRGGLRFGEMERDAGISHGASSFLRERLMLVSDGYQAAFCKNCSTFAVNSPTGKYKPCSLCRESNFGKVTIPYAYKLLIHLLAAFSINLRPSFVSSEEYANKIFNVIKRSANIGDIKTQLELEEEDRKDEIEETDFEDETIDASYMHDE